MLLDQVEHGLAVRQGTHGLRTTRRIAQAFGANSPVAEDLPGHDPVPGGVDVNSVIGQSESWITLTLRFEISLHRLMNIHNVPAVLPLGQQPCEYRSSTSS